MSDAISNAVNRAEGFVLGGSTPLERIYWETLLRRQDARALLAALAAAQAPDGSLGPGDALAATLRGLTLLDALGLLDHSVAERAVAYLLARQHEDGGFDAAGADLAQRIALTGEVAGLLAKTPFARASALERAEAFLSRHWSVERVQGPCYAPILAYMHAFTHLQSESADEALQWCGRELERGFRTQVFDAVAVARVFLRARARALPGASIDASELVVSLLAAQQADGGWPAAEGASRGTATLDAVEALLRLGSTAG